jgi:hypothetical protein
MIWIVGPFALEAAITVQHACMVTFALHAELLCSADCELDQRSDFEVRIISASPPASC